MMTTDSTVGQVSKQHSNKGFKVTTTTTTTTTTTEMANTTIIINILIRPNNFQVEVPCFFLITI